MYAPMQVRAISMNNQSRWSEPILLDVSVLLPTPAKMTENDFNITKFVYQWVMHDQSWYNVILNNYTYYTCTQRRLVMIFAECAFNYHAPLAMYCFCWFSGLTWVAWVYIAAYGKCALIRIHDQLPLTYTIAKINYWGMSVIWIHEKINLLPYKQSSALIR